MRAAEDHCQAAYITSLLGSQDLKQMILGRSAEECPPLVTADMLQRLSAKTEQEETTAELRASTQKVVSTRVDKNNVQKFLKHTSESVRDRARVNSGSSKLRSMVKRSSFPLFGPSPQGSRVRGMCEIQIGLTNIPLRRNVCCVPSCLRDVW